MKVFFYDGVLRDAPSLPDSNVHVISVDAAYGVTFTLDLIKTSLSAFPESRFVILTNSILALSHEYAWNENEGHTEIYIWSSLLKEYVRIDKLTERDIRYAHNIRKMYLSGVFRIEGDIYEH